MSAYSVGKILRDDFDAFAQSRALPMRVHRAARMLMRCRTAALGGHVQRCANGHVSGVHYNSCRHRSCPQCSRRDQARWSEFQANRLLACDHYHVIFTLPHELNELWSWNRAWMMDQLFAAAAQSLTRLLSDPRFLAARPGMMLALHTWGRTLSHHPHAHALVSAGGLSDDGQWRASSADYLVPVRALKVIYRGKFLAALEQAVLDDRLSLPTAMTPTKARALLKQLSRKSWNIRIQSRYRHGHGVLRYLARYVRGGPIKNQQIRHVDSRQVVFSYRDHRDGQSHTLRLSREAFLQRLFWHVPVANKQTTRYYGLYRPQEKPAREHCRRLLGQPPEPDPAPRPAWQAWLEQQGLGKLAQCKRCGASILAQAAEQNDGSDPTMSIATGPQSGFLQQVVGADNSTAPGRRRCRQQASLLFFAF
jgi:hypothetical protein